MIRLAKINITFAKPSGLFKDPPLIKIAEEAAILIRGFFVEKI